ncbi:MAG: NUDIX hydrolase [Erysipelotrichaceae bacterium]|nr:NUDIX hydrolase [Erysipelotrichaceae bacterium]
MNEILKEEVIYEGRVCRLTHDTVTFDDGTVGYRDVLHLNGAVGILAFKDEDHIMLVQQYRHAIETDILELPAGMLEKGEDPLKAAERELEEETGYKAGKMTLLASFFTSPGVVRETIHLYLATDLTFVGQHLDDDEYLSVRTFSLEEIEQMIADNRLNDGKSILAYLLWKDRFRNGTE